MNNRNIWIYSILFALISASVVYFVFNLGDGEEITTEEKKEKFETKQEAISTSAYFSIDTGKRAVTIPVSDPQGVSGFIIPGSFVDIIQTLPNENSQLLVENIKVLAVGRVITKIDKPEKNTYDTVTLQVTPAEGTIIVNAINKGTINLMLRGT